jgi:cytochrome P450
MIAPEAPLQTCPAGRGPDERKTAAVADAGPAPGAVGIGDFELARKILRSGAVRQAGFKAELVERNTLARPPVLFQEGEAHQKQRSATARFFAPRVVGDRYRQLMLKLSARLVGDFRAKGRGDLDRMSAEMAVAVAAEIVGLTDSPLSGLARRIDRLFSNGGPRGVFSGQWRVLHFFLADVKPAIRARRRNPREDVISHLISQGYKDSEILTECITYGAAGMATTREFIVIAAWHLFEHETLRAQFMAADEAGRMTILEEVLRLEPVVGALYRRAERDLTPETDGVSTTIPAGSLIAIDVRAVNADTAAAGEAPLRLDPARCPHAAPTHGAILSFGDGPHRCPGATVALLETAVFLGELLQVPGIRLAQAPAVTWNPVIAAYELHGAMLSVD